MLQNRQFLLFFGDVCMLGISYICMILLRFDSGTSTTFITLQTKLFIVLFIVWIIVFFIFDLYSLPRANPNPRNIGLLFLAMLVNIGLSIVAFYIASPSGLGPKTNLAIVAGSAFILLVVWRRLFYTLFTSHVTRTIALVGLGYHIEHLKKEIKTQQYIGTVVHEWSSYTQINPIHIKEINLLISEDIPAKELTTITQSYPVEPMTLFSAYETLFAKIPVEMMTNEKALAILTNKPNGSIAVLYRIIEIIIACIVLIITSPFLLLSMLGIFIEDRNPLFYSQKRVGKNGALFSVYKLRSMRNNAEKHGAQWATENDARVTRVGKILRKLHIDEIPQMWNIIRGDIALIGPRPERPEFVKSLEKTIPYYYLRHSIKPGFTGWAQIKFRYARSTDDSKEKFEYDLYYLKNKNPLLDFGILLKTIQIIFTH